jgi:SAM-dependent methyltransferase
VIPARLREGLGYLNWLLSPRHGLDAGGVYSLIAERGLSASGYWLNLGYWEEAADLDAASDALALRLADLSGMGPGDQVVDCGFGYGDQDLLWMRARAPARIVGLNVTARQVTAARSRVAEAGLDDRVDLRQGSATAMPLPDASADLVVALESAFHFHTREAFFREAYRVLRPGGRIATADILPMPPAPGLRARLEQRLSWGLVASRFAIPEENAYGAAGYHDRLAAAGFRDMQVTSIREQVYAPLHAHLKAHPEALGRLHPVARPLARAALTRSADGVYRGLDYVLARAVKPGADTPRGPRT